MPHTVPVSPAMVAEGPSSARIVSEHALATSVFQATVTECVVRSCRYGPRVSVAAFADAAASSTPSSAAPSAATHASEQDHLRRTAGRLTLVGSCVKMRRIRRSRRNMRMPMQPVRDRVVPDAAIVRQREAPGQGCGILAGAEPHHDVVGAAGERAWDAHLVRPSLADLLGHEDVVVEGELRRPIAPLEGLSVAERGGAAVTRACPRLAAGAGATGAWRAVP